MTTELDKEIAFKVVLPKLQKIVKEDTEGTITSIAKMRAAFNSVFDESISAVKFQDWIDLLDIKFQKKVVIVWPTPPGPGGPGVVVPPNLPELEEEAVEDAMKSSFPPIARPANLDAFGQMQ